MVLVTQHSADKVSNSSDGASNDLSATARRATDPLACSALALAITGCGGGSSQSSVGASVSAPAPTPSPTPTPTSGSSDANRGFSREEAKAARFLLRADFTASSSSIKQVREIGAEAWLDRRMIEQNAQTARQFFDENNLDEVNEAREFQSQRQLDRLIWDQLIRGGNGTRKRIAFALSGFFVVSINELSLVWPVQAIGHFWDILNEHAFGNFRELLEAITLSPAMAAFLDTLGNQEADPKTGRVPDENFARELMQLFTIGLYELNRDGSLKAGPNGPIETYSNDDVQGLAKVFTGYNLNASGLKYRPDPSNGRPIPEPEIVRRPITSDPKDWEGSPRTGGHSSDEKAFLGVSIPRGTSANESRKIALDTLFNHPNVAPFFSKQMIQRLVTSNPSREYIDRVASKFENNGQGVRGDLSAVFKQILLDDEANAETGLNDYRFGKLREPAVRFVQFGRQFNLPSGGSVGITRDLSDAARYIGQVPFRAPSVFSFFRPTYSKPQSVMANEEKVGPEFQIVNETSVAGYLNFITRTVDGRGYWLNDWRPDFQSLAEIAENPIELVDRFDLQLTGGQLRDSTRETIISALQTVSAEGDSRAQMLEARAVWCAILIFASNDYLVQK